MPGMDPDEAEASGQAPGRSTGGTPASRERIDIAGPTVEHPDTSFLGTTGPRERTGQARRQNSDPTGEQPLVYMRTAESD